MPRAAWLIVVLAFVPVAGQPRTLPVIPAPVSAVGLAAGHPFEAWVQLVRIDDPHAPGLAMAAGDRIAVTFPAAFAPIAGDARAYLLYGWPQGDAAMRFRVSPHGRTIDIVVEGGLRDIAPASGIKAVHLAAPLRNPRAGDYRLHVVAAVGGTRHVFDAPVRIAAAPSARIAPFNALHGGANENGLTARAGTALPMPLDFLAIEADGNRAAELTLETFPDTPNHALIMQRGVRVGEITASAGTVLVGESAPADGVVRVRVTAPRRAGTAEIRARFRGADPAVLQVHVTALR